MVLGSNPTSLTPYNARHVNQSIEIIGGYRYKLFWSMLPHFPDNLKKDIFMLQYFSVLNDSKLHFLWQAFSLFHLIVEKLSDIYGRSFGCSDGKFVVCLLSSLHWSWPTDQSERDRDHLAIYSDMFYIPHISVAATIAAALINTINLHWR